MIGKFFGFTGMTLLLSNVAVPDYNKMIITLDTPTNRDILNVFKRDLEKLIEVSNSFVESYVDPKCNRDNAVLTRKRDSLSEEEIRVLEESLDGKPKIISRQYKRVSDGNLAQMSDEAYAVVTYLKSSEVQKRLNFYNRKISYSKGECGVQVFGEPLYTLRYRKLSYLLYKVCSIFEKDRRSKTTLSEIKSLKISVETLESFVRTKKVEEVDKSGELIDHLDVFTCMDEYYMNDKLSNEFFEMNLDSEGYKALRDELREIGIHGFTMNCNSFYKDFIRSVSLSGEADVFIYENTDCYKFVLKLRKMLNTLIEI